MTRTLREIIVRRPVRAYVPVMPRILRLLALLAVLLSPLSMIVHAPAMAAMTEAPAATAANGHHQAAGTHQSAMANHCAPQEQDEQSPARSPDCALACAALASGSALLTMRAPLLAPRDPLPLLSEPHGLDPEAATPPPRPS